MVATENKPLTVEEVAAMATPPRKPQQVVKWIKKGLAGPNGSRIKLKASKLGQTWSVDPPDLAEFIRRLTEAALAKPEAAS